MARLDYIKLPIPKYRVTKTSKGKEPSGGRKRKAKK